jgi:nucleolar MIF4G domain-containing protein 1
LAASSHVGDKAHVPEALLKLAKQQNMNTDVRKAIFVILMISKDYVEAFEHLLKLDLKNVQEREIPRVILHCCGSVSVFSLLLVHNSIWPCFS